MTAPISQIRMRELHAVGREAGLNHADLSGMARDRYGVSSMTHLSEDERVAMARHIRDQISPPPHEPETKPMTLTKGFPKLLVPRPDPTKPRPAAPAPVMHAARPVDHVKLPPRYIPPLPPGQMPVRPPSATAEPKPPSTRPKPDFLTRVQTPPRPAAERQTGGYGKMPAAVVQHTPGGFPQPAEPVTPTSEFKKVYGTISPDDIPF